jgi:hypothetical protein
MYAPTIQGSMVDVHLEIQYLYIIDNLMGMVEVVVTLLFPTIILWNKMSISKKKCHMPKYSLPKNMWHYKGGRWVGEGGHWCKKVGMVKDALGRWQPRQGKSMGMDIYVCMLEYELEAYYYMGLGCWSDP